jgi:predicted Zn-dependent protease
LQRNDTHDPITGRTPEERTIEAAQEENLRLRISTFPNDSHSWFLLGCVLRKQKRLKEAERALRRAVTLNPAPTVFWSELALVLQALGHDAIDPDQLKALGPEMPESEQPPAIAASVRRTKREDSLRKSEAIPRMNAHVTSPCISCPDYTYYGCRRREACADLIRWRTGRS